MLLQNPFRTEEWTYYVGNRLIAVAYVDALPEALAAIYCYYDPTEGARSLGTFNILSLLVAKGHRHNFTSSITGDLIRGSWKRLGSSAS